MIDAGILYESTGGYGESTLREVDLTTGRLLRAVRLPQRVFGEGLTAWGERLIQLSWQSKTGFVFDKASLT
ncbi:MAG: glutamine cyclotransferase, partial [Halothiobacillaceae bacterium]